VLRAATRDERVCLTLMKVTNLLAPPSAFFHPKIVWQVLRQTLAPRKTGGGQATPGRLATEAA
jgi:hypothetical protein